MHDGSMVSVISDDGWMSDPDGPVIKSKSGIGSRVATGIGSFLGSSWTWVAAGIAAVCTLSFE